MREASLPSGLPAMLSLTHRELVRFARQPARLAAGIGTPLLIWVFLASGFARASPTGGDFGQHLLPGMIGLTVVFSSIFAAISLIEDRNEGFLQGVLVSPLPRWALVASKVLGGSLIASGQAAILLPGAFVLGMNPTIGGIGAALGAIACTSIMVNALSLAIAWRIDSVQGFHGVMNLLLMPMWLLSGAFIPIGGAAPWLRAAMLADPLTWTTQSLRIALTPEAASFPADSPVVWLVTVALALASLLFAAFTLGRTRPGA